MIPMHSALRHSVSGCALAALVGLSLLGQPAAALEVTDPLAAADRLYARGQLAEARAAYQDILGLHRESPIVLGRLARVEIDMSDGARGETRRRLIAAAVSHSREAVKVAPESAETHVWLGVALGRQSREEGPRTRLALAREIKSEVDRAIAIDPWFGRAYHERALWNRAIASLNFMQRSLARAMLGRVPRGASMDNAVRDFRKAIELEPDNVSHHLELGRTLHKLRRYAEARHELEKAVALPATGSARDAGYQAEARNLLGKLPRRG